MICDAKHTGLIRRRADHIGVAITWSWGLDGRSATRDSCNSSKHVLSQTMTTYSEQNLSLQEETPPAGPWEGRVGGHCEMDHLVEVWSDVWHEFTWIYHIYICLPWLTHMFDIHTFIHLYLWLTIIDGIGDRFLLKTWMWLQRALELVGAAREISLSLSCPFHCGQSFLPWFLLGLFVGLFIGLSLAFYLLLTLRHCFVPAHSGPQEPAAAPRGAPRRSRLSGYLDEWDCHSWSHIGSRTFNNFHRHPVCIAPWTPRS